MLQIADAVEEASTYILNEIDSPWLGEVYISDEIGKFTFHLFVITGMQRCRQTCLKTHL